MPVDESVRPRGQSAGVGQEKVESLRELGPLHYLSRFKQGYCQRWIVWSATLVAQADKNALGIIWGDYSNEDHRNSQPDLSGGTMVLNGILEIGTAAGGFSEESPGFEQLNDLVGAVVKIFRPCKN